MHRAVLLAGSRHLRSVLAPLFKAANTYSAADQQAHLKFIDEHVICTARFSWQRTEIGCNMLIDKFEMGLLISR
jgi:hypothetical protein